jgi:hypothetical protein
LRGCVWVAVFGWLCVRGCVWVAVFGWQCLGGCVWVAVFGWQCLGGSVWVAVFGWQCLGGAGGLRDCAGGDDRAETGGDPRSTVLRSVQREREGETEGGTDRDRDRERERDTERSAVLRRLRAAPATRARRLRWRRMRRRAKGEPHGPDSTRGALAIVYRQLVPKAYWQREAARALDASAVSRPYTDVARDDHPGRQRISTMRAPRQCMRRGRSALSALVRRTCAAGIPEPPSRPAAAPARQDEHDSGPGQLPVAGPGRAGPGRAGPGRAGPGRAKRGSRC